MTHGDRPCGTILAERVEALENHLRWALLALKIYAPAALKPGTELADEFASAYKSIAQEPDEVAEAALAGRRDGGDPL